MAVVEVQSFHNVLEAIPPDVRRDIIEWLEALAAIGWPAPQFIGPHPERPDRPSCVWGTGIRWEGEAYTVAVSCDPRPDFDTITWLGGCPIPPPISAYRWAAAQYRDRIEFP